MTVYIKSPRNLNSGENKHTPLTNPKTSCDNIINYGPKHLTVNMIFCVCKYVGKMMTFFKRHHFDKLFIRLFSFEEVSN